MTKGGRILDKDFEEGITNRASDFRKEAQDEITRRAGELQREAQSDINKAQKYAYKKNDEVEAMISDHPKAFVLGSFIGGFALGTLFSRGNK